MTHRRSRFGLPLLLALAFIPLGCAGSQVTVGGTVGGSPDGSWSVGINVGINIARSSLPIVRSGIAADTALSPTLRAQLDHDLALAGDSLQLAQDALRIYEGTRSASDLCRAHEALQRSFTLLLDLVPLLQDAGVQVPALLAGALSSVGSFIDMIYPACASPAGPDAGAPTMARASTRGAAQQRAFAALSRRSR